MDNLPVQYSRVQSQYAGSGNGPMIKEVTSPQKTGNAIGSRVETKSTKKYAPLGKLRVLDSSSPSPSPSIGTWSSTRADGIWWRVESKENENKWNAHGRKTLQAQMIHSHWHRRQSPKILSSAFVSSPGAFLFRFRAYPSHSMQTNNTKNTRHGSRREIRQGLEGGRRPNAKGSRKVRVVCF